MTWTDSYIILSQFLCQCREMLYFSNISARKYNNMVIVISVTPYYTMIIKAFALQLVSHNYSMLNMGHIYVTRRYKTYGF